MKLKQLLEELNQLAKEKPEALETNVNIKELIQQAEKAERYKKDAEYYKEMYDETWDRLEIVKDFFKWLVNGEVLIAGVKNVDDLREIISSRLEKSDQNWLLAKERAGKTFLDGST